MKHPVSRAHRRFNSILMFNRKGKEISSSWWRRTPTVSEIAILAKTPTRYQCRSRWYTNPKRFPSALRIKANTLDSWEESLCEVSCFVPHPR